VVPFIANHPNILGHFNVFLQSVNFLKTYPSGLSERFSAAKDLWRMFAREVLPFEQDMNVLILFHHSNQNPAALGGQKAFKCCGRFEYPSGFG
jgi:hypothetical protein